MGDTEKKALTPEEAEKLLSEYEEKPLESLTWADAQVLIMCARAIEKRADFSERELVKVTRDRDTLRERHDDLILHLDNSNEVIDGQSAELETAYELVEKARARENAELTRLRARVEQLESSLTGECVNCGDHDPHRWGKFGG